MDTALIVLAAAILAGAAIVAAALIRARTKDAGGELAPRLDALSASQGEIAGRFAQAIAQQGELQRLLTERIEALDRRLADNLKETAEKTAQTLGGITERLNVIDQAQSKISDLSGHVVSLQEILSDKQARGAFGQERMEAIVSDQLPPDLYEFQGTLSNGTRPDCIIRIPNLGAAIVVDCKFPLESFEALRGAETDPDRKSAAAQLRADMQKHVRDISEKYLIHGEVQAPAIMFVPSESVYAELHHAFADVVQRARRAQVMIVSPHIFWLAINTLQTLMRDARMREQAHLIQHEVAMLLTDVKRLGDRIANLRQHFDRTGKDIGEIEISLRKITARAGQIEAVDLAAGNPQIASRQDGGE